MLQSTWFRVMKCDGLVVHEWAEWATKQKSNLCFLTFFFSTLYLLNKNVNDLYRLAKRLGARRHV
jgi:hypothetical protein